MPKHDLPDGNEAGSSLIDFRQHLRRRVSQTIQDESDQQPEGVDIREILVKLSSRRTF